MIDKLIVSECSTRYKTESASVSFGFAYSDFFKETLDIVRNTWLVFRSPRRAVVAVTVRIRIDAYDCDNYFVQLVSISQHQVERRLSLCRE